MTRSGHITVPPFSPPVQPQQAQPTALVPAAAPPWALDSCEGRRLAASMPQGARAALARWREGSNRCWEPQQRGHYCAPASAVATLRFFGIAGPGLSQTTVYERIVVPNGLFTSGVSFEHGHKMMELLAVKELEIRPCSSPCRDEVRARLRADLQAEGLVLLANYWRPGVGGGHWSPLGGFAEDKVLVLDTAADRFPPQWMPLDWIVEGLCRHNDKTGRPRGYLAIRRRS